MKFFPLIWAALWRKRPRTIFTMLSIVVAFLLFGLLKGFTQAFNTPSEFGGADRLVTISKYSLTQILPYSFLQEIRSIEGVKAVSYATWFGGVYKEEKNFFAQFPVDPRSYLEMYPEMQMPEEQKQAFANTRTGAIIAKNLADRYGFKIGDKIPIKATIWPATFGNVWTFDLVGIFDNPDPAVRTQIEAMLFQHEYFDEARAFAKGTVGWYMVRSNSAANNAAIALAVDARFKNSPNPTRTDTEKAFNQSFVKQIGDIGLIVTSILGAVFFTLLFLTGNTMMQSVRERIPELAVLKTLGYTDNTVLALVLAEAVALCLLAALLGLGLSSSLLPLMADKIPGFGGMKLLPEAWALGLVLSLCLAVVVGLPPALRARRLSIVDALAGR